MELAGFKYGSVMFLEISSLVLEKANTNYSVIKHKFHVLPTDLPERLT